MANQSTAFRPQPPSIKDPNRSDVPLDYVGEETETEGAEVDQADEDIDTSQGKPNWGRRAKDAYRFSTSFTDTNYRRNWEDSIKAFNGQHPSDSKYNSEVFRKRSNIFVPKTRSIIRKNEAAAAAAFFSNLDRISVTAMNQSEEGNRVSAEVMEALLQYRLTKSVPWFQTCMGAIQDGQTMGACVAHIYWKYSTRKNGKGEVVQKDDKPCVDLIPLENFRFDPSAHWTDPVGTSPYVIQLIPMYVVDVKQRMARPDPKGKQWTTYPDSALMSYDSDDSTRRIRFGSGQDPANEKRPVSDYDICWIHRHIHRWNGTDYEFYMLASEKMLTEPEPLENSVFHGQRPYVMGVTSIETHKALPTTLPMMVKDLQAEINEIKNSRLDNVKFVLNKGFFVKRGKNVDVPALVRNVPGRVVLTDDPEKDIVENSWPDVTQSSYLEEDRNNANFDELVGNFSAASVQTARAPREPARAMTLLQAPSTVLTEYMLKTFSETFIGPVLRQLVLLEQHYETDPTVLSLASKKSKLFKKFGMDKVTDELLERELLVNVNVGMGSTDPVTKLQKFLLGVESFTKICVRPPPGVNLGEVMKEIMALSGYQDGDRFMMGDNPETAIMQQQMQKMKMQMQQLMINKNNKEGANAAKVITSRMKGDYDIKKELIKQHHDKTMSFADHIKDLHMGEIEAEREQQAASEQAQREQQATEGQYAHEEKMAKGERNAKDH